jgi:hypothetical protein
MQLMPPLLEYLERAVGRIERRRNDTKISSHDDNTAGLLHPSVVDAIEGGVDFGVVAVWSCPNSCEGSREEFVVVQAPL